MRMPFVAREPPAYRGVVRRARQQLTYANVVATLALLLALSGGAYAASRYLITSTRQISPKVLRKLRGRTGKTGPEGRPGLTGVQGLEGPEGKHGKVGPQGNEGPPGPGATAPLRTGESESGLYGMSVGKEHPARVFEPVSLPVVLAAAIPEGNVEYRPAGSTSANCPGLGKAAAGWLCIYSNDPAGAGILPAPTVLNLEAGEPAGGSGPHGFELEWFEAPAEEAHDIGQYTITAP
jgi:hypothetical protein